VVKNVLAQLKQVWSGGDPTQRVLGVLSLAVIALGLGFGAYFASRPDMALLFGGLDPADAASVVEEVRGAGVAAEVRAGGTAVYVAQDRVDEMRMVVASAGLPKASGSGWELFDESGFGVSDFVQNVNYLRAMQTSLGKAIERFDGVAGATVQISRAKRSPFIGQDQPAKASVIVEVRTGGALSKEHVRSITHLVAGAVEGLDPGAVSLMDTRGRLLSEPGESGMARNTSNQVEYQRDVEEYLREKAQRLLDQAGIVASVRVGLDLDFQQVRRTREKYDPEGTMVSETVESRSSQPSSGKAKGAVSSKQQIEGAPQESGGDSIAESEERVTTEMKVGRTVESEENTTPQVKRMYVGLVVHDKHQDRVADVVSLVKTAVGFDATRGDVIESLTSAFEAAAVVGGDETTLAPPLWPALVERGLQIVGILGALFVLYRLLRAVDAKPVAGAAGNAVSSAVGPERVGEIVGVDDDGAALVVARHGERAVASPVQPNKSLVPNVPSANLPEFVRATVKQDPSAATRVLQSWLRDGERN
jgi:flagellar M-ring protein FliF